MWSALYFGSLESTGYAVGTSETGRLFATVAFNLLHLGSQLLFQRFNGRLFLADEERGNDETGRRPFPV
jgi:hypothetical protein